MKFRAFYLTLFIGLMSKTAANTVDVAVVSAQFNYEAAVLPEMAAISDVRQKKQTFFGFLEPIVQAMNQKVEAERAWLKSIESQINENNPLAMWQQSLLNDLARYYKVDEELGSGAFFQEMFLRVDTIPASLVLAQAANESAWGTSRFATEGNNLFGQWCFTKGCGLVPAGRDSDAHHEVKVFETIADSVASYFRNLNTHYQYQELRTIREEIRFLQMPVDSIYLAWGLEGYSIRGEHYIRELINMIQHNKLQSFDIPAFYARNEIRLKSE